MACAVHVTGNEYRACCKTLRGVTALHGDFEFALEDDDVLSAWRVVPAEHIVCVELMHEHAFARLRRRARGRNRPLADPRNVDNINLLGIPKERAAPRPPFTQPRNEPCWRKSLPVSA